MKRRLVWCYTSDKSSMQVAVWLQASRTLIMMFLVVHIYTIDIEFDRGHQEEKHCPLNMFRCLFIDLYPMRFTKCTGTMGVYHFLYRCPDSNQFISFRLTSSIFSLSLCPSVYLSLFIYLSLYISISLSLSPYLPIYLPLSLLSPPSPSLCLSLFLYYKDKNLYISFSPSPPLSLSPHISPIPLSLPFPLIISLSIYLTHRHTDTQTHRPVTLHLTFEARQKLSFADFKLCWFDFAKPDNDFMDEIFEIL